MIQAPMNPAESLLNFIIHHTDLYMRKKKGVPEDALWRHAFGALSPWLAALCKKVREEERAACVVLCNRVADEYGVEDERSRGAGACAAEIRKRGE